MSLGKYRPLNVRKVALVVKNVKFQKKTKKTRKYSCVDARGIPPAVLQVLGGGGYLPWSGGYLHWGSPHPDLARGVPTLARGYHGWVGVITLGYPPHPDLVRIPPPRGWTCKQSWNYYLPHPSDAGTNNVHVFIRLICYLTIIEWVLSVSLCCLKSKGFDVSDMRSFNKKLFTCSCDNLNNII